MDSSSKLRCTFRVNRWLLCAVINVVFFARTHTHVRIGVFARAHVYVYARETFFQVREWAYRVIPQNTSRLRWLYRVGYRCDSTRETGTAITVTSAPRKGQRQIELTGGNGERHAAAASTATPTRLRHATEQQHGTDGHPRVDIRYV